MKGANLSPFPATKTKYSHKIGDKVAVFDDKLHKFVGMGEVIAIEHPPDRPSDIMHFVRLENKTYRGQKEIWGERFFITPEQKFFEITKRMEDDLENVTDY